MSNKTLALILIVAIVISIGGTLISLDKLGKMKIPEITGFADSDAGTVYLRIPSVTAVNWSTDIINWSSGQVDAGQDSCWIDSNGETGGNESGNNCSGTNAFQSQEDGLVLVNIGNKNLTLNLSCGEDADDFIGGAGATYRWNVTDRSGDEGEANSCMYDPSFNVLNISSEMQGLNVSEKFGGSLHINCSTIPVTVCNASYNGSFSGGLMADDTVDTLRFNFIVRIPSVAPSGVKEDTITATVEAIT